MLGGADFGGGVWDLLARGPRRKRQRALIAHAIGPIWEANHVWLILVVVLLFTCFPAAFARLSVTLHIPLTLMLVGIVLRGSAFTFRDLRQPARRRAAPLGRALLVGEPGHAGAARRGGRHGRGGRHAGDARRGTFVEAYVAPWLQPFPLAIGALALALFAFLAAVYLTVEADDADLQDDFRRRALGGRRRRSSLAAMLALVPRAGGRAARVAGPDREPVGAGLPGRRGRAALADLLRRSGTRRYRLARVAAPVQAALILCGLGALPVPVPAPARPHDRRRRRAAT